MAYVTTSVKIDPTVFEQWLNRHWKGSKMCPICSTNNWHLGELVVELQPFQQMMPGGSVVPLVPLTCLTCGHTLLFNALLAGLVEGH